MKNRNCTVSGLALLALALTATHARAQSTYTTPYAFTNFAGLPATLGTNDGMGSLARFKQPRGVALDANGNLYVADTDNSTIRKITPDGTVTTLAGSAGLSGSADGTNGVARFNQPNGVALDSAGNIYAADYLNSTIRKITPAGVVTTLAGSAGQTGSANGTNGTARFTFPAGVAVDGASNVYVADTYNYTIRKITPAGVVTTLAGSAGQTGSADGTNNTARFNQPSRLTFDNAGNIYVADSANHTIRKITPAGAVTTLAGSAGLSGSTDATGSAARFNFPEGVAVDSAGYVYVADRGNSIIRKITPGGVVTTLAGIVTFTGSTDGIGTNALFNQPYGVAVDSAGKVFVADSYNHRITKANQPASAAPLQFETSVGGLAVSNGFFLARLTGPPGSNAVLESSADFQTWKPIQTNSLPPGGLNLSVLVGTNQYRFFRARLTNVDLSVPLQFDVGAGSLMISNGFFLARLTGPSGSNAVVESSADFQTWTPVQTNALPPGGLNLSVPVGANQYRFFRARLAP